MATGTCIDDAQSCGSYACKNANCATTCVTDSDCRSYAYCSAGACVARKPLGDPCGQAVRESHRVWQGPSFKMIDQ